jgi:C-terminal peptidase prc
MRSHVTPSTVFALPIALSLIAVLGARVAGQEASPSAEPAPSAAASVAPSESPGACVEPEASLEPIADAPLSMPEQYRIDLFNGVWEGIRDYYVDPDTNGVDWDAIGDEYAPLILATDDAYEVYDLLREMVESLDDPFTGFYSPEDLGDPVDPSYGGIGALLDTSAAGEDSDGLRIVYVFDGGSAADAGIRPRDRIIGVEGDDCARIADIRGPVGTSVTLTVASPGEVPREVTLERRQIDATIRPVARRLESDPSIGYLQVLALSGQAAVEAITAGLGDLLEGEPLEGLVLDLRASNQGAPAVTLATLATFVRGQVGAYHSRVGEEPIEIEPNELAADYAEIPLAVLVDAETEADAEQLAAILQDQDRAVVVGAQTSGQTHGATTIDFPEGSLLQIVAFGFELPDGATLEGVGVTPDIVVDEDWLAYAESEDPMLLAALEALRAAAPASPEPLGSAAPDASTSPPASVMPSPSEAPAADASAEPSAEASPAG